MALTIQPKQKVLVFFFASNQFQAMLAPNTKQREKLDIVEDVDQFRKWC